MSNTNLGEVFAGGATTSQHVDAEDDDHFQNTTFKLKRTRSIGLLDEFIDPSEQERQIAAKNEERERLERGTQLDGPVLSPPVITPTPPFIKSPELIPHDDSDLVPEPSRHVDYLSHHWDVSDISKSWRYVIQRRKDVANAARLENASWRTWAQRRLNLKTISPEEVNWSKESDVTWLYGPIVDDDDHDCNDCMDSMPSNTATSIVAGDISIARKNPGPKPILKKRTVQDMMLSHLSLLKLQVATARAELEQKRREDAEYQKREAAAKSGSSERPPEYFDYDAISAKLNSQYKNFSQLNSRTGSANNSSVNLASKNEPSASALAAKLAKLSQGDDKKEDELIPPVPLQSLMLQESKPHSSKETRHIHFNDEVQQCISLNVFSADDEYDEYDDDDENDYEDYAEGESYIYESYTGNEYESGESQNEDDDEDDDDEGGFFLKVRSPSSASLAGHPLPGLSSVSKEADKGPENEDLESISTKNSVKTIQLLPPTTLNYGSSEEESDECNPYTSSMSHNVGNNSSRGYDYHYDYNTVYEVDPNHAIYGTNSKKVPDVVDVPENITVGSNFDYDIIENDDIPSYENASAPVEDITATPERLPIFSLDDSAPTYAKPNPFSLDASDSSDSEDEGGLSISARNSSHSLAQQVFGQALTAAHPEQHFPEQFNQQPVPEANHISAINPRYSSTALSKQPHSSSSLSDNLFSGSTGMSKAKDSSLSDQFFNTKPEKAYSGGASPPVQRKASPLPPFTTSANAFLGHTTPPLARQASKKSFIFESDSDSDEEFVEDTSGAKSPNSYASLSQVADRNGITSSGDEEAKNKVGLAMANFLGGWNKNT